MKNLFLAIILSLLLSGTSFAEPFLTCTNPDPLENVTSYLVSMDGGIVVETPASLHYDLGSLSNGDHEVVIQAKNIWGAGNPSVPFNFTKQIPLSPLGVTIVIE